MLKYLVMARGKRVADVGCGTGLFAIAAAKLGASEVWATDPDPTALECARRNADRNGVKVTFRQGHLLDPIRGEKFDFIASNPPQWPAPPGAQGPKFAGSDGLRFLVPLIRGAHDILEDGGELLTMGISIAGIRRFEAELKELYRFRALPRTKRPFSREEFDALHPALFDFIGELRDRGRAEIGEDENGPFFWFQYYLAMKLDAR